MDWLAASQRPNRVHISVLCVERALVPWGYDMMALLADAFPGVRNFLDASSFLFTGGAQRNKCRCVSWADGSCTVSQLNRCVGGLMGVVKICHPQSATFPKSALSTQIPPILSNSWIQKHHKKPPSSYFSLERWRGLEWVMVPPSAVAWNSEMPANEAILMKRQMQGRISVIKADVLHCNQIQYNQWWIMGFLYVFVSTVNVILDMNSLKGVRPCRKGWGRPWRGSPGGVWTLRVGLLCIAS